MQPVGDTVQPNPELAPHAPRNAAQPLVSEASDAVERARALLLAEPHDGNCAIMSGYAACTCERAVRVIATALQPYSGTAPTREEVEEAASKLIAAQHDKCADARFHAGYDAAIRDFATAIMILFNSHRGEEQADGLR